MYGCVVVVVELLTRLLLHMEVDGEEARRGGFGHHEECEGGHSDFEGLRPVDEHRPKHLVDLQQSIKNMNLCN